ncbi:MAG: PQQ-binding-like beta-propeller repeat protein [Phycisphaerae bacterium]|nr:PQQ-binding-like beta-propeller repeat protein [Phycisphaerae bacterium]
MSIEIKQQEKQSNGVGYQSAIGVAVVTAVFSIFIILLLGLNVYHTKVTDPVRMAELEKMKEQAKAYPADQILAQEIQQLDTQLRRDQFARLYFLERGTILLIVTLVLFTGSVIWAKSHRPGLPRPAPQGDLKTQQIQHASRTRLAFIFGLVLLCAGALFWIMHAPQMPAGPLYTSMDHAQSQWSAFRGPGGLGIAEFDTVPDTWDGKTSETILWKSPILLPGHNSPVVWEDRIFLTGATQDKQQVYCYDTQTGKLLWQRDVSIPVNPARDDMDIMEDTGYAANTAVTDGKRVCAIFAGGDVGCFTVEGQLLWEKHFGIPESMYGYAASLTWFENVVIIQWDVGYEGEESKLIALDWQTGDTVWETKRPVPNSWSSPTVVKIDGQYRIVTTASPFVIVYDPKTGIELYRVDCVYGDMAATPIVAGGKIFTIEPYNKLVAVDVDESLPRDDEQTRILWENDSEMPDICSPLSNGQYIWTLTTPGNLSCFDITDGSKLYTQSLKMTFQASPTVVGQRLYLLSEKGTMLLLEAGPEYKEIRRNELGEKCFASPAFQDGRVYIRGDENLYAIGKSE